MHSKNLLSTLLLVGAAVAGGSTPALCLAELSFDHAAGHYTLHAPTPAGLLDATGTSGVATFEGTAQLSGSPEVLTVHVQLTGADSATVVADFGAIGNLVYSMGAGAGARGNLISTTIPRGRCSELDTLPALSAVRNAFETLQRERGWETRPDARDWYQAINNLAFFFVGNDLSADCAAMARPQDHTGCDFPFGWASCGLHGKCCDWHDDCFSLHNCGASSWACLDPLPGVFSRILCRYGGGAECAKCNLGVVSCFAGPGVGPADCCSCIGGCGQPRSANLEALTR